jgi:purine-binding chemotaxis protein CheW
MFYNDSSSNDSSKFLDVEFEHKRIGIMIDSATEVRKIPKSNIEKVTAILDENIEYKYADAIIKLNEGKRMVLLLDLSFILNFM